MIVDVERFVLRVKRPDTPFYRRLRKIYDACTTASLPVPLLLKPLGRLTYETRFMIPRLWKRFKAMVYTEPVFRCRCESVGKRLKLNRLPSVLGHTLIHIGDDVRFSGHVGIISGRFREKPTLRIGNRVFLGHNVSITCNQAVTIEDNVLIAANCMISDYDGHPADEAKRLANSSPAAAEIRPVRIGRGAWIGYGALILKGVTVGEGSIVGANSVVTHDVPPHSVVVGSPAKVVRTAEAESPEKAKAVSLAA